MCSGSLWRRSRESAASYRNTPATRCHLPWRDERLCHRARPGLRQGWPTLRRYLQPTWRARWWNYYERGVSYAAGAFWDDAIADLRAAIKQRDKDQRRARTYGLHFLDYFPHRELGVVYYRLRRYPEAIRELETSLSSVDNAKAKLYLNRARKARLEQAGLDTTSPQIRLDAPADGLVTNRFSVTVAGRADDDTYVAAVALQGRSQFIELAAPRIVFTQVVPLRDGANAIRIVVRDLVGHETRKRMTVHLDRHGPLVSIDAVEVVGMPPRPHARVQGVVADRSPIARFELAGRRVPVGTATPSAFRQEVPISPRTASLPFEVADTIGNVTRGEIALRLPVQAPVREGKARTPRLTRWAALQPDAVMTDATPVALIRVARRRDREPPVIKLRDVGERLTVYEDRVYLEGQAVDASAITVLSVNGEPFPHAKAHQLFFGSMLALTEGDNVIRVEATDEAGNTAQRTLVVTREIPPMRQIESRLKVSLLPLAKQGRISGLDETVDDVLFTTLVNQRRFDLAERPRLEKILQELKLSQTDLVDPATAVKLGKIVAAEGAMIGKVNETPHSLEVFVRFVDVETWLVLAAVDIYDDVEASQVFPPQRMRGLMEGLAWKLQRRFPLVEGYVAEKDGKTLLTDLSEAQGIRQHMKLIIYREGKTLTHPRTGKILQRPGQILGEARIKTVSRDLSEAALLSSQENGRVQELDRVMTK